MTTKTAKFWVSAANMDRIKSGGMGSVVTVNLEKTEYFVNEVEISWQEPKKKVKKYRWAYGDLTTEFAYVTSGYYSTLEELKKGLYVDVNRTQKIEFTEIEVESDE